MAKYKLYIQRLSSKQGYVKKAPKLYFSVVDLEKGSFPQNFVCNFPKTPDYTLSKFSTIFAEEASSYKFAKDLLVSARREYDDLDVKQEIDLRLKRLKEALEQQTYKSRFNRTAKKLVIA